ncbi:hypothetical protein XFF6166_70043 [Xanthomonas citri pv. fuscans]|nr:hypothetical protein XFF6166_70043 [Xanthomonas citri pv. fuscans]SOO02040.1 hypothetical protein XFF6960_570001 [Xanthomonas citri pv. fuscans]SOO06031.1 hypothetical protein XFF7767_60001 [Xanthomonas citri pv. fuscans]SOO11324.1 hypothetical protein XFF6970_750001 [Xanthomonas citri pv. fuscans]SOO14803.1 hypothetical protein XFF7766_380044 [Xanthomonas citri pv. fuscans]
MAGLLQRWFMSLMSMAAPVECSHRREDQAARVCLTPRRAGLANSARWHGGSLAVPNPHTAHGRHDNLTTAILAKTENQVTCRRRNKRCWKLSR